MLAFDAAPLRLSLSFFLAIYAFFFSASSPLYTPPSRDSGRFTHPSAHAHPPLGYNPSGWGGDALKNRVFFTFMFVETVSWFWIWVTLQEERRETAKRRVRRRSGSNNYML